MESRVYWLVGVVLTLVVFAMTAFFGGVHEPFICLFRLLVLAALVLQIPLLISEKNYFHIVLRPIFWPLLFFLGFLVYGFIQTGQGLSVLSRPSAIGSIGSWPSEQNVIQLVFYGLFFLLCFKTLGRRNIADAFATALIFLLFLSASFGFFQKLCGLYASSLFGDWLISIVGHSVEYPFATFINANHFGGFLALIFPLALGKIHYHWVSVRKSEDPEVRISFLKRVSEMFHAGDIFFLLLLALTMAAVFLADARGAFFVVLFSFAFYLVVTAAMNRRFAGLSLLVVVLAGALLVLGIVGPGVVTSHFSWGQLTKDFNERLLISEQAFRVAQAFPLYGTGIGTFGLISSRFMDYQADSFLWDHAHNDYIELLAETGGVGAALLLLTALLVIAISIWGFSKTRSLWARTTIAQGWVAMLNIGVLEVFDFHLKTPAVALVLMFQLALVLGASLYANSSAGYYDKPRELPKILRWVGALVIVGLAVAGFKQVERDYEAYTFVKSERSGIAGIKAALEIQPENAKLWYALSRQYWRGRETGLAPLEMGRNSNRALRRALALWPTDAHMWFVLGQQEYLMGARRQAFRSLEKAVYWAPFRTEYQVYLLKAYLEESVAATTPDKKSEYRFKARYVYARLVKAGYLAPQKLAESLFLNQGGNE